MRLELARTAFDIDGVVVDVMTPFLRLLQERYNYRGLTTEDITDFDLAATLGIPERIVTELVTELLERPLEVGARPYPGAAEILPGLCRRSPLLFITSRPKAGPIRTWFAGALPGLPGNRIEIVATGDPDAKLDILRQRNRHNFIDDRLDTCLTIKQAGLTPLVFDQPWNRKDSSLLRVYNWAELENIFRG